MSGGESHRTPTRTFKFAEDIYGDDTMEVMAYGDGITITVAEAWQGDSETGFGASCSVRLDFTAARAFAEWLLATLPTSSP